jgi:hypothetical protein
VQIGQDVADANANAHVEERTITMRVAILGNQKRQDRWVQQQIHDFVQVGGDQNTNVLADIMIIDVAQLLLLKAVLGVMDHDGSMSEQHVAPDVVDRQEEAHVVRNVNHVHLVVLIELEELHYIVFQNNLLLHLLTNLFHVHVVVLFILIVDLIDVGQDLIIIMVE